MLLCQLSKPKEGAITPKHTTPSNYEILYGCIGYVMLITMTKLFEMSSDDR